MRISPHDVPSGKKGGGDRLVPFLTYLPPTAAAAIKDVSPETSLIIISGRPQQGLPPSNGIVAPSGGLRQDYSLEGSSTSGPNGNDSQQEGGILCIPLSSPDGGSHRRVNSGLEQMESSVCLPPEDIHDATSPQSSTRTKTTGPSYFLGYQQLHGSPHSSKGRRPFAPSRPARTIRSLRRSLKWHPKLQTVDRLHFLKEVFTAPRGAISLVHAFR